MKNTFKKLTDDLQLSSIKEIKAEFQFQGKSHLSKIYTDYTERAHKLGLILVPEWWGLNEYAEKRAQILAQKGYTVMALDVFGDGAIASDPPRAIVLTKPYYEDGELVKKLAKEALATLKKHEVDSDRIGIIGYCFGGYFAIHAGTNVKDFKVAVGFHPSLAPIQPQAHIGTKVLVCHGGDDDFEKDHVAEFKEKMGAAQIDYTFQSYPGSKHAFTNPGADANGDKFHIPTRYNAAADAASWEDLSVFLEKYL